MYPGLFDNDIRGASRHILVDSVDRSTHLQRLRTLPELVQRKDTFDDENTTTPEESVLMARLIICGSAHNDNEDWCTTLLALFIPSYQPYEEDESGKRNWNRGFHRKIVVLDFSDTGWDIRTMQNCFAAITAGIERNPSVVILIPERIN